MAEARAMPSVAEARAWIGAELTDVDGGGAGRVETFFVDAGGGEPVWLVAQLGRRRATRLVAVPLRDCAGAAFGAWVAHDRELLKAAPVVDATRPLRREHELAICSHFGISEAIGRAAEVVDRPAGEVTAVPLSS